MSVELGLRLLASSVVRRSDLERALLANASGAPFIRALLDTGAIPEDALLRELSRGDLPLLRKVSPLPELLSLAPEGLWARLLAVPVRRDRYTQTIDVAVVDPFASHVLNELAYHLGPRLRLLRAELGEVEGALRSMATAGLLRAGGEASPGSDRPRSPARRSDDASAQDRPSGPPSPSAPQPPFAPIEPFEERIRAATERDEIIDALLGGMRTTARRVGVLAVKKSEIVGFACNPDLADASRFRALRISTEDETVFREALSEGSYLGPLPPGKGNGRLLATMREASRDLSLTCVHVGGKVALILLADELGDTLIATRRAALLAKLAGEALARLVRERR